MHPIVFDIEADGLTPSKIHCLSTNSSSGKVRSTDSYSTMRNFFSSAELLVGHNIIRFDIPAVERLLDVKVGAKLVDTLAISWYLQPNRNRHGLESYGEEFGVPKVQIDDWEGLTVEEYMARCNRDVEINRMLWDQQYKHLLEIYKSEEEVFRFIGYLSFKLECAAQQEKDGWLLDVKRATEGAELLYKEQQSKVEALASLMPDIPRIKKRVRPAKPFKQDGSYSAHGLKWIELLESRGLPLTYNGTVLVEDGSDPGNPNSPDQIKNWLFGLGWVPDEYRYVREEDKSIRKIPQINKQTPGEVGVCESVKLLYEKEPGLEVLDGLSVISHRLSILNGFLKNVDENGYIKAEMQGLTNTLRYKHTVIVNLPGVDKPYGELIRGCLIAPEGYELCGADMSGLEERIKHHFIWAYDPDYVKEQLSDDFDPHINLAVFAGAMTKEQEAAYKGGDKTFKPIRHVYKQVNYACVYGALGPRVAISAGVSVERGNELVEAYWKRNWSVKRAAEDATVKKVRGEKWIYNPISRFWYSLRSEKDRASTLFQGGGTYCFDVWIMKFREKRKQLTGQFHDEVVLCHKTGIRERVIKLLEEAIEEANLELNLNRRLDIDIQFGRTYADIH